MATKSKEYYELIKKSLAKSMPMMERGNTMYEKIKAVRRTFLLYIRIFDDIKHDWEYNQFCRVLYKKSLELLKQIEDEEKIGEFKVKEENYINYFKKNLKKIKKMCEDTSITYYALLPDRMPIDVRTHCIQFISPATIN